YAAWSPKQWQILANIHDHCRTEKLLEVDHGSTGTNCSSQLPQAPLARSSMILLAHPAGAAAGRTSMNRGLAKRVQTGIPCLIRHEPEPSSVSLAQCLRPAAPQRSVVHRAHQVLLDAFLEEIHAFWRRAHSALSRLRDQPAELSAHREAPCFSK